ncbi:unnamed protein product [Cuscuta campestris]|uniref:Protein CHUP1, chloroplastic n=1 Tax=Cuscuta campestris TaxID=132261 RepID=A0A484M3T7_9ASTE|nr:unnamed protein product [Cuscuta campestris]
MEAKLFALKIESLKADKKKLEAQMADSATVVSELEAARVKVKQLKKKVRHEAENRKEQICALQEKVMKLQDVEKKALETLHNQEKKLLEVESDAHTKVQRIAELEIEAEELRSCNNSLRTENSELAQRLEYVQIIATSVLDDEEMEALVAEAERLRKQNADMAKEIEQLRSHRCSDAEELVYLRWVNACLRYELRNYQPDPDKTVARDLSKTLSPKSEERAKQLILEYARREEEGVGPHSGSSKRSSSSQASFFTPTEDTSICSLTPTTHKAHTSGKRKVFGKMMRLLRGKHKSRSSSSQGSFDRSKHFQEDEEEEEEEEEGGMSRKGLAHQESFRTPELVKYADALKEGRNLPSSRGSRRSASFGSLA